MLRVIIEVSILMNSLSNRQKGGFSMMGPFMMRGFELMFLMGIFWLVVIGLVIWGISILLRKPSKQDGAVIQSDTPMDILKRRYAKGEIDKEEYETKKKDLSQ